MPLSYEATATKHLKKDNSVFHDALRAGLFLINMTSWSLPWLPSNCPERENSLVTEFYATPAQNQAAN